MRLIANGKCGIKWCFKPIKYKIFFKNKNEIYCVCACSNETHKAIILDWLEEYCLRDIIKIEEVERVKFT